MSKSNGGPAFPTDAQSALKHDHYEGMTLRDYFAAQSICGCWPDNLTPDGVNAMVKGAYALADAMLAERDR